MVSICLYKNEHITSKGYNLIFEGLKINKSISILNLTDCKINDDICEHLSEMLKINTTIEVLKLDKNDDITSKWL